MVEDIGALPRIFMQETTEAQKSALVEESVGVHVKKNVECIEEPWDMERALGVIRAFLTRMREMGGVNAEEEEAFSFLLDNLTP